jgi:hypothetical protein
LASTANYSPLKVTGRYAYLEIEETPSKHSVYSEKQVEQAILYGRDDTPSANNLDSSGATLVDYTNLPVAQGESP